jgi:hypothetical protein
VTTQLVWGPLLWGILLPQSVLRSQIFAVLSAFVAINTLIYVALTVAKLLPKIYLSDWFSNPERRRQTRGIHPDGWVGKD